MLVPTCEEGRVGRALEGVDSGEAAQLPCLRIGMQKCLSRLFETPLHAMFRRRRVLRAMRRHRLLI
jgi:hypothetical protein